MHCYIYTITDKYTIAILKLEINTLIDQDFSIKEPNIFLLKKLKNSLNQEPKKCLNPG